MRTRVCSRCQGHGRITFAAWAGLLTPDVTGARIFDCPTCLGAGVETVPARFVSVDHVFRFYGVAARAAGEVRDGDE